jgi:integrase
MARVKRRLNLTNIAISRLEPGTHKYLVYDSDVRWLAVEVQPTGNRFFKFIRCGRWRTVGPAEIGVARARKIAIGLLVADVEGPRIFLTARKNHFVHDGQNSTGQNCPLAFAELYERYLTEYAKQRNKSWQQYDRLIRRLVMPAWGSRAVSEFTRAEVRDLFRKIESPSVANLTKAAVSAVFTWAAGEDLVDKNPCSGIKDNPMKSRERILSDSEIRWFWPHMTDGLKALLLTGQRPGEVRCMRHEDIIDGWWCMSGGVLGGWPGTKNGLDHRVWLPAYVKALVPSKASSFSVFVFTEREFDQRMRDIGQLMLTPMRVTPHDLRRTHGTFVTRLGFGRDAMNRIQNHKDPSIASVYDRHTYAEEDKKIMEVVAAEILKLAAK